MPSKVPAPSRQAGTTIAVTASLAAGPAPTPAVTGADSRRWLILAVVALAQLMVVLDATIVNIALPSAQHALHFSDTSGSGWSPRTPWPSAACCCWAAGSPT